MDVYIMDMINAVTRRKLDKHRSRIIARKPYEIYKHTRLAMCDELDVTSADKIFKLKPYNTTYFLIHKLSTLIINVLSYLNE